MRKIFIGIFAAVAAVFLAGSPAFASADSVTWSPATEEKQGSYYLEEAVPQDARNTIESALELAEVPSNASRHLYVAKLPEGSNVQTAAREVAKTWELNKDEQSLVLYDVTSGGTFVWPATEANVSLAASLNGGSSVDEFATQISSLYDNVSSVESGSIFDSFPPFILVLLVIGGFFLFLIFLFEIW